MSLQICRWTLAFIWIYQGLVPKLLGPHADELAMNLAVGATLQQAVWISYIGGVLEIVLGLMIIFLYRWRLIYIASALTILGLHCFVVLVAPVLFAGAFNPMIINLAIAALSLIALGEVSAQRRPPVTA